MVSRVEKKDFSKYLVEARSWESDKVRSLEMSRRTAWIVAGAAGVLSAISIVTVAMMTPLQRVEAYVVKVDQATGLVNVVRPMDTGATNYDEAINKYFTQWYVRWREGFLPERAQEYYTNVGMLSSRAEQMRFLEQYDTKNKKSPLNLYKNYGRSIITIKSTVFDGPTTARIQFTKEEDFNNGKVRKSSEWMAMIHYRYNGAPMSDRDRQVNPLGFQVLNYTVVQEKPPVDVSTVDVGGNVTVPVVSGKPSAVTSPAAGPVTGNATAPAVTVPAIAPMAQPQQGAAVTRPAAAPIAMPTPVPAPDAATKTSP